MEDLKPLDINSENVSANFETYLEFLKRLEALSDEAEDYRELIHEAVEFRELPNLLNKNGQVRNLATSLEGIKKAKMILSTQNYEIVALTEARDRLAVEKIWTGTMAADIGNLKKGQQLKAYICAVVEFKDGKIYRHRTYDCYEPFREI